MIELQQGDTSDIELVDSRRYEPVLAASPHNLTGLDAVTRSLSPKRNEDVVAEALQVDGWRFGAGLAALTAAITFIINLTVGIWAATRAGSDSEYNSGILVEIYHGSCDKTKTMNTWSHLGINVVSTGLLAGSNFCMQCLVAPTRQEVDRAHRQSPPIWLDIGLPSIRNLKSIERRRTVLWALLAVSSLPLHLL